MPLCKLLSLVLTENAIFVTSFLLQYISFDSLGILCTVALEVHFQVLLVWT